MVHGSWLMIMTQDERWNKRYQDVMDFMEKNHRNPSRHRLEEHDMLNWVKQQNSQSSGIAREACALKGERCVFPSRSPRGVKDDG